MLGQGSFVRSAAGTVWLWVAVGGLGEETEFHMFFFNNPKCSNQAELLKILEISNFLSHLNFLEWLDCFDLPNQCKFLKDFHVSDRPGPLKKSRSKILKFIKFNAGGGGSPEPPESIENHENTWFS